MKIGRKLQPNLGKRWKKNSPLEIVFMKYINHVPIIITGLYFLEYIWLWAKKIYLTDFLAEKPLGKTRKNSRPPPHPKTNMIFPLSLIL